MVEAGDMDTASWSTAACAPLKVFVENRALGVADKIQVEIRNPTEFNCDRRWAHLLLDALRKTSDGVADAVKASLGDFWSLISYHMQVNEKHGSPPKLAVVMYCRFKLTYRFDLAEDAGFGYSPG